ncbi:sugar kinase [Pseudomonas typographi]|uniref:Sugar kinase n=1 Tax=Pseudomonas typographi TaxID=2715964 RepID=A0ABR7Z5B0_9PSED|nr:sugar kinase [Pseudomonas typographi]MBD1554189.1 sugar kinase [Pseudomonas typographi]MBD1589449.1 sugar kinase [Pseudomonas typographi]MBD1600694.1 sugar kinase [Pseudomonas typographi]
MNTFDVLSFGETMAMFVANESGDLADVGTFHKRIAGADSNVAIGLSRLGFKVAWLSRVGNDSFGRFVIDTLRREGLDCSHVTVDHAHPTGFQLKSRESDGRDPAVEYFRRGSAASHLSVADLAAPLLQARHLHATGIPPALSASAHGLATEVMASMRQRGRSVSFDPNLRPSLWPSEQVMIDSVNALAAKAHWVLPGLAEGRLLTGQHEPADIAAFYLDKGVEAVAIKLGAQGAYFRTAQAEGTVPGFAVAEVVDTVGAGDGFAVGVISALLEGQGFEQAVRRGNWVGSLAVQSPGDSEGLPDRAALETAQWARTA